MKCKQCNRELDEGVKFCPHCGTEVVKETESQEQAEETRQEKKTPNVKVNLDETIQSIATKINERLAEKKPEGDPLDKEAIQKMVKEELKLLNEETRKKPVEVIRRGEFAIEPDNSFKGRYSMRELLYMPTQRTPEQIINNQYPNDDFHAAITQLQEWNDRIYILSVALKVPPQSLRSYTIFQDIFNQSPLKRALDTQTASEGLEFIPTGFSSRLTERYLLELKLATLFDVIEMPTSPFKSPYGKSGATGYYVSEAIADSSTKIKASTAGTGNVTFTARGFATRGLVSEEATEDSIVPMIPFMERDYSLAIAEAVETAIFNGDRTTSGHMDTISDVEDARYAFDGLRYKTQSGEKVSFSDGNPTHALMNDIRQQMGKFAADPTKMAYIMSINAQLKLQEDGDVKTMEKFGALATVLRGELGKLDNIPIIVSEKSLDTYDSTGVGTSGDRGVIQAVFRPGFAVGQRKGMVLKWKEDIETGQMILVIRLRADFQSLYDHTANAVVAQGYNVNAD